MKLSVKVRKNTYYDSVALMLISKEVKKLEGVKEALVGMGTELNKELAQNLGLSNDEIKQTGANDFFIAALAASDDTINALAVKVEELLNQKSESAGDEYSPPTFDSAVRLAPGSNLVIISLPGQYAFDEVKKALNNNIHVLLFSDNVKIEEEKELKELAKAKGLLLMGPDCGTAIINNVPLAFANVVKKGSIGIVGASGTGTQEVSVLIDKFGSGVSQVIGTGGRDLSKEIGGIMMIEGIKALAKDPFTKVIVLISKPPAAEIAEKVLAVAKESGKPFVVNFIGGSPDAIKQYGGIPGANLEDTAYKAVALARGEAAAEDMLFGIDEAKLKEIAAKEVKRLKSGQKYLRGVYTGGTLCDEAMKLLATEIGGIYSNIPLEPQYRLPNVFESKEHTCVDLGDDEFTVGRAHPMIDPSMRQERLVKEAEDEEAAVILMDFVLGYGANIDPAGEMVPYIEMAKDKFKAKGKELIFIASVCGTENDPQNLKEQEDKLRACGVLIMPSNAQAVKLAAELLKAIGE